LTRRYSHDTVPFSVTVGPSPKGEGEGRGRLAPPPLNLPLDISFFYRIASENIEIFNISVSNF